MSLQLLVEAAVGYWQLLREDRFLEYYIVKELWCLVCCNNRLHVSTAAAAPPPSGLATLPSVGAVP